MKTHGEYIDNTGVFMKVAGVSYEQAEDLILNSPLELTDGTEEEWPVPQRGLFSIYLIEGRLAFAISHDADMLRIYVGHVAAVYAWAMNNKCDPEIVVALREGMNS